MGENNSKVLDCEQSPRNSLNTIIKQLELKTKFNRLEILQLWAYWLVYNPVKKRNGFPEEVMNGKCFRYFLGSKIDSKMVEQIRKMWIKHYSLEPVARASSDNIPFDVAVNGLSMIMKGQDSELIRMSALLVQDEKGIVTKSSVRDSITMYREGTSTKDEVNKAIDDFFGKRDKMASSDYMKEMAGTGFRKPLAWMLGMQGEFRTVLHALEKASMHGEIMSSNLKQRPKHGRAHWRRFWFVLDNVGLSIYDVAEDDVPKRTIPLQDIVFSKRHSDEYGFRIDAGNLRWVLQSGSLGNYLKWTAAICAAQVVYLHNDLAYTRFMIRARVSPDLMAIRSLDRRLSYAHLGVLSFAVGYTLVEEVGVGLGQNVVLWTQENCNRLLAMLGIVRAGGIVIPVNSDCPWKRVEATVQMTGTVVVVVDRELLEEGMFSGMGVTVVVAEEIVDRAMQYVDGGAALMEPIRTLVCSDDGAIGVALRADQEDCGVVFSHKAVWQNVLRVCQRINIVPNDVLMISPNVSATMYVMLTFAALSVSASVLAYEAQKEEDWKEQLHSLGGGTIFIGSILDLAALIAYEKEKKSSILRGVRLILIVDIAIHQGVLLSLMEVGAKWSTRIVRALGHANCPLFLSLVEHRLVASVEGKIPADSFLEEHRFFSVNSTGQLLPYGKEAGEVFLSGPSLPMSRLGRNLSMVPYSEPSPWDQNLQVCPMHMYGNFDYGEDKDEGLFFSAVFGGTLTISEILMTRKTNWFRLEELYNRMMKMEHVTGVQIEPIRMSDLDLMCLVAYVSLEAPHAGPFDKSMVSVRVFAKMYDELRKELPSYMLPCLMVWAEESLTQHPLARGKSPQCGDLARMEKNISLPRDYEDPQNGDEMVLCYIFAWVFRIYPISSQSTFFTLGGNISHAFEIVYHIERFFSKKMDPSLLLTYGSPVAIARYLQEGGYLDERLVNVRAPRVLQRSQQLVSTTVSYPSEKFPELVFVSAGFGLSLLSLGVYDALPPGQRIVALQPSMAFMASLDRRVSLTLREIATELAEVLLGRGEAPVLLSNFFMCTLAHEIAVVLASKGRNAKVIMVNPAFSVLRPRSMMELKQMVFPKWTWWQFVCLVHSFAFARDYNAPVYAFLTLVTLSFSVQGRVDSPDATCFESFQLLRTCSAERRQAVMGKMLFDLGVCPEEVPSIHYKRHIKLLSFLMGASFRTLFQVCNCDIYVLGQENLHNTYALNYGTMGKLKVIDILERGKEALCELAMERLQLILSGDDMQDIDKSSEILIEKKTGGRLWQFVDRFSPFALVSLFVLFIAIVVYFLW